MRVHFFKYQATGNDFVIIDNRQLNLRLPTEQIVRICDRRFGVGADGLMLLEPHPSEDFRLVYYNSDGSQSLCGNGSRAAVQLAARLGIAKQRATFEAYDGLHEALIEPELVRLKMNDVQDVRPVNHDWFIHTGSPHFIRFVAQADSYPVTEEGRQIRYSEAFAPGGTNANFVEMKSNNTIFVRTYERGVEAETLSCGTGVTAAALAASLKGYTSPVHIETKGGTLSVAFKTGHNGQPAADAPAFRDIFLIGPAKLVFEGDLEL
jgi:diaminopimelate epimerase